MRTVSIMIYAGLCVVFYGCNPEAVPLKAKYVDDVTEIVSDQSPDSAWSKLNHLFTSNGLEIKSIDKSKGLVRTKERSINGIYTFEDKNGRLEQPQAWVVLASTFHRKNEWKPKTISGQWSVQVTETKKGQTTIKVDPIVICTYFPNPFTKMEDRGQSTGNLEKLLTDYFKPN